jgi:hypothetical protein
MNYSEARKKIEECDDVEENIEVLKWFLKNDKCLYNELLIFLRDLNNIKPRDSLTNLIIFFCHSSEFPPEDRIQTSIIFYDQAFIVESRDIFYSLVQSDDIPFKLKSEVIPYFLLFGDQRSLDEITSFFVSSDSTNEELEKPISRFFLKSGEFRGTYSKFKLPDYFEEDKYDDFLLSMIYQVINKRIDDIDQHFLKICRLACNLPNDSLKRNEIHKVVLSIAREKEEKKDLRILAADIIYNLGYVNRETKMEMENLILRLGYKEEKGILSLSIYSNSQNVHDVDLGEGLTKVMIERLTKTKNLSGILKKTKIELYPRYWFNHEAFDYIERSNTIFLFGKTQMYLEDILMFVIWENERTNHDVDLFRASIGGMEKADICDTGILRTLLLHLYFVSGSTIALISPKVELRGKIVHLLQQEIMTSEDVEELIEGAMPESEYRPYYVDFSKKVVERLKKDLFLEFKDVLGKKEYEAIFAEAMMKL